MCIAKRRTFVSSILHSRSCLTTSSMRLAASARLPPDTDNAIIPRLQANFSASRIFTPSSHSMKIADRFISGKARCRAALSLSLSLSFSLSVYVSTNFRLATLNRSGKWFATMVVTMYPKFLLHYPFLCNIQCHICQSRELDRALSNIRSFVAMFYSVSSFRVVYLAF